MTSLAIIGSGILGRSLIYTLAKEKKLFEKITLFYSDSFTPPCTLSSTAIVAPRGLSAGLSPLGDALLEGFNTFADHVSKDGPEGVEKIVQYTAATKKLDDFKKRYPSSELTSTFLKAETLMQKDSAYLVDPKSYSDWLLKDAAIEVIEDLVTEVHEGRVTTLGGKKVEFDKVIFAGGSYNRFWQNLMPDSKKLKSSKPIQGSYYEWSEVPWDLPSFSLTLDGDNLIWDYRFKRLLVGSSTLETHHLLPPSNELQEIFERLERLCALTLPPASKAVIKTGLREKAQKREPYIESLGNYYFLGGLYKNGYTLALKVAKNFSHLHL